MATDRIEQIRQRMNAATPEPSWGIEQHYPVFIVYARSDIQLLLAEIDRLTAALALARFRDEER